jgi:DNA-binding MarR family transcriptional regulator
MDTARSRRAIAKPSRQYRLQQWRLQAAELVYEIVATGERIAAARGPFGDVVYRTDPQWVLLKTIKGARCCPSFSDLGRMLRVSRQAARELGISAARAGRVELLTNPDDRRIIQAVLTPQARSAIAEADAREAAWLNVLLNGLGPREMTATTNILRVVRHRLLRDERERARR